MVPCFSVWNRHFSLQLFILGRNSRANASCVSTDTNPCSNKVKKGPDEEFPQGFSETVVESRRRFLDLIGCN